MTPSRSTSSSSRRPSAIRRSKNSISVKRAEGWAYTVKRWYNDPLHPGRQVGWAEPETTPDYVRPVKRLVVRWHNGQKSYAMLLSTLAPRDVLQLLGQPASAARDPELLSRAYAQFYDKRGAVIIGLQEDGSVILFFTSSSGASSKRLRAYNRPDFFRDD